MQAVQKEKEMSDFELNVNKIGGTPKVMTEAIRVSDDADIYDLRRQIEARQTVKEYVRAEILRLQALLNTMTQEIIALDLKLQDRKPAGEPRNLRRLYAPGTEHQLSLDEPRAIDTEIVE
jgi:hypothetical protein